MQIEVYSEEWGGWYVRLRHDDGTCGMLRGAHREYGTSAEAASEACSQRDDLYIRDRALVPVFVQQP